MDDAYYTLQHYILRQMVENSEPEVVKELCVSQDEEWAHQIFDAAFQKAGFDGRQEEYKFRCVFTHAGQYPALVYHFDQDFEGGSRECLCRSAFVVAADEPHYFLIENGSDSGELHLCAWTEYGHVNYGSFRKGSINGKLEAMIGEIIDGARTSIYEKHPKKVVKKVNKVNKYKAAFLKYLDDNEIVYQDQNDGSVCLAFKCDHMDDFRVDVIFSSEDDANVAIFSWSLGKVKAEKRVDAVEICNQLNDEYRWVKFSVDEYRDIAMQIDSLVGISTVAEVCWSFVNNMVEIADEVYPTIREVTEA